MSKHLKRLLSLLLALMMVLGMLPTVGYAQEAGTEREPEVVEVVTPEHEAELKADVLGDIANYYSGMTKRNTYIDKKDFYDAVEDIKAIVFASKTYVEDSIRESVDEDGNCLGFYWQTTTGITCGYFPEQEYKMATMKANNRSSGTRNASASACTTYNSSLAGPNDVCLVAPMYSEDSSFTEQYGNEAKAIADALGGTAWKLTNSNATVTNIGDALSKCRVVIFDSHGNTDWGYFDGGSDGSGEADNVTKANTSYLCLSTGTGMTSADMAYVAAVNSNSANTTFCHAYSNSQGYYVADGTCFANHMTSNAPDSLLWMAICLGMSTPGMYEPLRAKGVSVVYGYSQSVSFTGDYAYEEDFWDKMIAGETVATAAANMKSQNNCNWDPAYSSYSLAKARYNYCAFPNFVSDQDSYQGQRSINPSSASDSTANATAYNASYGACNIQTVASTWKLLGEPEPATVTLMAGSSTYQTITTTTNTTVTLPSYTGTVPSGYSFAGWTTDAISGTTTTTPTLYTGSYATGSSTSITLYACFSKENTGSGSGTGNYVKVTSAPSSWAGDYVIVYETGSRIFDGSLSALDSASNYQSVTISNNTITAAAGDPYKFTIAASGTSYTIQSASGYYIGNTSNSNTLSYNTGTQYTNSISLNGSDADIVSSGGAYLRYNSTSGQDRFRYFKSSTYTNQQAIQLYKKDGTGTTYTYTTTTVSCSHTSVSSAWTYDANSHWHVCNDCGAHVNEAAHTYSSVVTAPTVTEQGYTTYTCTVCSQSYVDDYTQALGTDYTVSFSVPSYVTAISPMTSNTNTGITLPTAGNFTANGIDYTFVGWVSGAYDNVTSAPSGVLTGQFTAQGNVTLIALYKYAVGGSGEFVYRQVTAAPSDWSGDYVISYLTNSAMKVLTSSASSGSLESTSYAKSLTDAGITLDASDPGSPFLTGVADAYVFEAEASGSAYTLKNKDQSIGTYLGSNNGYLNAYTSYSSSNCDWTITLTGAGNVEIYNGTSSSYPYISANSSGTQFWMYGDTSAIYLWKAELAGTPYWTTVISGSVSAYNITAAAAPTVGGTVSSSDTLLGVSTGATATFEAIPATGYQFDSWTVTGTTDYTAADEILEVTVQSSDVTVTANFSKISYAITVDVDPAAGGTVSAPQTATYGDTVNVTATPASGYGFSGWLADGVTLADDASASISFTMPANAVTLYAFFAPITNYTVSFTTPTGVTPPANMTCASNGSITLPTASAPEGYTFLGWVLNDVNNSDSRPSDILTGSYTASGNVTLKALYTYSQGGGTGLPGADFAIGDVGEYVIAAYANSTWYALPANPTVSSGKINGVTITVSDNNGVSYVAAADAVGYVWTVAASGEYYTISDGSNYIYHSNGGASGTSLAYGSSTSYLWSFVTASGEIRLAGVAGGTVKTRGMLFRYDLTTPVFGGYALSNAGSSGYANVKLLPVAGSSTAYYTTVITGAGHTHNYVWDGVEGNGQHTLVCNNTEGECNASSITEACTYTETVTAPTPHTDGYTTHTCTVCGYSYTDNVVGAYDEYVLANALNDGDQVVLYNPAYGKAVSNADLSSSQTNYRAGVDVTPENDRILNPDAAIVWRVVTTEGGFYLTDADGHKLSTGSGRYLLLDGDNDVWTLQAAANTDTYYLVNATAVGSSGDPLAMEWYSNYSEFTTYYLNSNITEGYFAMQLYVKAEHALTATDNGDGTHTWTCNDCGYAFSEAHTFENGVCTGCGAVSDESLVYDQVGFSVEGAIRAQFAVYGWNHTNPAYDSYYMIVKHTLADGTEETSAQIPLSANDLGGYTIYVGYYDIHAKYMADRLDVTVYGVTNGAATAGPVSTTSIREIAAAALTGSNTAASKKVYADMLAYGAQAQIKFNYNVDDLANALTGEALTAYNSYVTNDVPDYVTLSETSSTPAGMGTEKASFYTTALSVEERVYLQFGLYFGAYDVSSFTVRVTIGDRTETVAGNELVAIDAVNYPGYYVLVIDTLDAVEGQTPVSVTVYEGQTPVSKTATNTIENLASTKTGDDKLLANRLVNFYRSITALINP